MSAKDWDKLVRLFPKPKRKRKNMPLKSGSSKKTIRKKQTSLGDGLSRARSKGIDSK